MTGAVEFDAFVRRHIRSVWALELLLLLRRDASRRWSAEALVAELRASTRIVADVLDQFQASGLAAPEDEGYRYAPALPAIDRHCTALEKAYRERPVAIITLITRPEDPVRSLADAFRFKRGGS